MKIPGIILATITRRPRYQVVPGVDFHWNSKLWVHDIFRAWEVVFGKKYGKNGVGDTIRAEGSVAHYRNEYGEEVLHYQFYSWEAFFAFCEGKVRAFLKKPEFGFRFVPVPQPVFAGVPGMLMQRPIFNFAIAFGNFQNVTAAASPNTTSVTTSGSNLTMFCPAGAVPPDTVSGVTFNGVSMTKKGTTSAQTPSTLAFSTYILMNAFAGTANGVISGSGTMFGCYIWWSGTKTSGQPDNNVDWTNVSPYSSSSITSVADNCWSIVFVQQQGGTASAGTGTTLRETAYMTMADSNGVIHPAGSSTLNISGLTGSCYYQMYTIAPFVASVNGNMLAVF